MSYAPSALLVADKASPRLYVLYTGIWYSTLDSVWKKYNTNLKGGFGGG